MCQGRPPGFESPFEGVGHLRQEIQSELRRKADDHEVHTLRSTVHSLESTVRRLESALDGVRSELSELQENLRQHTYENHPLT